VREGAGEVGLLLKLDCDPPDQKLPQLEVESRLLAAGGGSGKLFCLDEEVERHRQTALSAGVEKISRHHDNN